MPSSRLRIGARVPRTSAEGPGVRYALWLQGCSIRCPGCCNPHLFDPDGGTSTSVRALLREVARAAASPPIEGVTLLGGEPFEQAGPAADFGEGVRALGLSVIVFSGYTLEELKLRADRDPGVGRLLAATDVLVDGPYDAARPETGRRWAGSTNQRFHYLSGRYSSAIERPGPGEPLRTVEVRLTLDGRVSVNGWPAVTASGWSRPRDGELRLVKYGNVEP